MHDRLFAKGHWHAVSQNVLRKAQEDVMALDRCVITAPSLAGHLDKIAAKYSFEVAALNVDAKRGKRRDKERVVDDYGSRRAVKYSVIDVSIPFTGDRESFNIAPSHSHLIYAECEVGENALVLTVPDNDGAQKEVDEFVKQVSENLDRLRSESKNWAEQLKEAIAAAAERRKQQVGAERERNNKLNFPVD
jgi:hypothetical protein